MPLAVAVQYKWYNALLLDILLVGTHRMDRERNVEGGCF